MLNANEGANATFAVSLSGVPAEDVTITYTHVKVGQAGAVQPLASLISVSPAELVFLATGMAGELKETTLTVIDNTSPSDPSNRELILVSTCEIGGLECNFTVPTLTIQSIDNDNVVLYGTNSGGSFQVAEGQSLQVPVSLQYEPASPYTISFASGLPEGVRVTPQSLQFGPTTYANKQTLTIEAVDDKNARGKPTRLVTLSPKVVVDGVERTDVPAEIQVTLTDNDTPDIVVTSSNPYTSEAGNSSTLRVSLAIQPLSDTTVKLTVVGRIAEVSTGQSDPSSITFTADNWNFPIDVQVTGTDNQQVDGLRSFNVRLVATPSGSPDFEGVTGEYTMYIIDNDVAELSVLPPLLETSESDTSGVPFEIMLSTQPKETVELLYTFPNPLNREGTLDRGGRPDTVISDWWNQKVVRKMTGVDDQAIDGDNFYNLTIRTRSADPFWNGITVQLPVVNRDNDGYKQVRISPYATRDPAKRIQISELGFRKRSSRGAVDVNVTEASTTCYFDGNGDHAGCPGGAYTGTTIDGVKNTVWTSILGGIHLDVTFDQPQVFMHITKHSRVAQHPIYRPFAGTLFSLARPLSFPPPAGPCPCGRTPQAPGLCCRTRRQTSCRRSLTTRHRGSTCATCRQQASRTRTLRARRNLQPNTMAGTSTTRTRSRHHRPPMTAAPARGAGSRSSSC